VTQQGSLDLAHEMAAAIAGVFAVESVTTGGSDGRLIRMQGQLVVDSQQAYEQIAARFKPYGYTALMRKANGQVLITAIPRLFAPRSGVDYAAIGLFVFTVLSVLFVGGLNEGLNLDGVLTHPLAGLPFAASLLAILMAHEAGHYLMSRRMGVAVSLPYFIPLPLPPFGTMGSVIRMQAPMRNRRQALAIGAAGPLAGLLVAIPLLIIGLSKSVVAPLVPGSGGLMEGNSLLYAAIKYLVFGRMLPGGGYDVMLHPMAFAAWGGLLVTMLNLIPAGQLDGGHVAYALLGERTRWINRLAVIATAALGLVQQSWLIWALLLLVLGQRSDEPLDEVTELTMGQKAFAMGMLLLFVLLFMPRFLYEI